jgi:hypothetical protein
MPTFPTPSKRATSNALEGTPGCYSWIHIVADKHRSQARQLTTVGHQQNAYEAKALAADRMQQGSHNCPKFADPA